MSDEVTLLERQYRLAIDARDKLNDNYHKWMTFYYVANGAVLVPYMTQKGELLTWGFASAGATNKSSS